MNLLFNSHILNAHPFFLQFFFMKLFSLCQSNKKSYLFNHSFMLLFSKPKKNKTCLKRFLYFWKSKFLFLVSMAESGKQSYLITINLNPTETSKIQFNINFTSHFNSHFNQLFWISVSVALIGGNSEKEGNAYALNPSTGVFGPVCDDNWDLTAVIFLFCSSQF
jgi:hypothetical protein